MGRLVDRRGRRAFLWRDIKGKIGFIILRQMSKGERLVGSLRRVNARHLAKGYRPTILVSQIAIKVFLRVHLFLFLASTSAGLQSSVRIRVPN